MSVTNDTTPHSPEVLEKFLTTVGHLVERAWPNDLGQGTLADALRDVGKPGWHDVLLRHVCLLDCKLPVLAVAGLLNAGKSSVICTFLSKAGCQRVLRGLLETQGTQRFVLWCPSSWQNDEIKKPALEEVLKNVFGPSLDFLSDDVAEAHRQYNGVSSYPDAFHVPLLAFDDALDATGIAVLDCPDVNRPYPDAKKEDGSARRRLEVLKQASTIASALLIVATQAQKAHESFTADTKAVLSGMPGIPWWLLINFCHTTNSPDVILNDLLPLTSKLKPQEVYLAYDYNHLEERWRERTPKQMHDHGAGTTGEQLPAAYLAECDVALNPPNEVAEDRLLVRLTGKLMSNGGLGLQTRAVHVRRLVEAASDVEKTLRQHTATARQRLDELHDKLLRVCHKAMIDDKGALIVPLTPQAAERLKEAMIESAPGLQRALIKSAMSVQKAWGWVTLKRKITHLKTLCSKLGTCFKKESTNHAVKKALTGICPERCVDEMHREAFALKETEDDVKRKALWKEVLDRHHAYQPDEMSVAELKPAWDELWAKRTASLKARGFWEKARDFRSLVLTLILLLAVFALASVDGGATLAMFAAKWGLPVVAGKAGVLMATQVFGYLSVSEILLVFGVGGLVAPVAGWRLQKIMESKLGLPSLSHLYNCACDVFGLPHIEKAVIKIGGKDVDLPRINTAKSAARCQLLHGSVWKLNDTHWQELHTMLEKNLEHAKQAIVPAP